MTQQDTSRVTETAREGGRANSVTDSTRMLTVREFAHYLRLNPSTVYRLLRENKLPGFKIGESWRIGVQEIEQWQSEKTGATRKDP
jgi:excisionase family DNA binding protein